MVVRMEDVGYFHKEEIIIAQHKLDEIDITDNDQLIQFISDFLEALEDRIYTVDVRIEFKDYRAIMNAIVYHNDKKNEYIAIIKERLPNCNVKVKDHKIYLDFIGTASHSVSIIAELLNIDGKQIDNSKGNIGKYCIVL